MLGPGDGARLVLEGNIFGHFSLHTSRRKPCRSIAVEGLALSRGRRGRDTPPPSLREGEGSAFFRSRPRLADRHPPQRFRNVSLKAIPAARLAGRPRLSSIW